MPPPHAYPHSMWKGAITDRQTEWPTEMVIHILLQDNGTQRQTDWQKLTTAVLLQDDGREILVTSHQHVTPPFLWCAEVVSTLSLTQLQRPVVCKIPVQCYPSFQTKLNLKEKWPLKRVPFHGRMKEQASEKAVWKEGWSLVGDCSVQFSSVPWPIGSLGRHEGPFSTSSSSLFCRKPLCPVLAWARKSTLWLLPEEVPVDRQGSWSCSAHSHWSWAPSRRCGEVPQALGFNSLILFKESASTVHVS